MGHEVQILWILTSFTSPEVRILLTTLSLSVQMFDTVQNNGGILTTEYYPWGGDLEWKCTRVVHLTANLS